MMSGLPRCAPALSKSSTPSKPACVRIQSLTSFLILVLASFHPVSGIPGTTLSRGMIVDPDDLDALLLHARDDVLHSGDDLIGGRPAPDVVGAQEQHHMGHPGMGEDVAVEAVDAGRAVGRRVELARVTVLPPMPSLITAWATRLPSAKRSASASSQRSWASSVEQVPSVMESPKATMVVARPSGITSIDLSQSIEVVLAENGLPSSEAD